MRALGTATLIALGACRQPYDEHACKLAAAEVGAYASSLESVNNVLLPQPMTLVLRDDLPVKAVVERLPLVIVMPTETTFQGAIVGADLQDRLTAAHAQRADDLAHGRVPDDEKSDPDGLLLEADAAAPWAAVLQVADAAVASGYTHVTLVFGRTPPPPNAPHPSAIDRELATIATHPSPRALAELAGRVARPCPALTRLFSDVGGPHHELFVGVGPALAECRCAAEPASVRALFAALYADPWPVTYLPLEMSTTGIPLDFPLTTPWRDAGRVLIGGSSPVHFVHRL